MSFTSLDHTVKKFTTDYLDDDFSNLCTVFFYSFKKIK